MKMSGNLTGPGSGGQRTRGRRWGRVLLLSLLCLCALIALLLALLWALTSQADGHITTGGERRSYLLHVPASYDPAMPGPAASRCRGPSSGTHPRTSTPPP